MDLNLTPEQIESLKKLNKSSKVTVYIDTSESVSADFANKAFDDLKKMFDTPPPPPRCECGAAALGYKKPGKFHSSAMPCPLYHE